jgi:hypothetical protein
MGRRGLMVMSGRATVFDMLAPFNGFSDPIGWGVSGAAIGRLALTQLQQFAGYAQVVSSVPGEWSLAGRVLIAARPDHSVTIDGNEITHATGNWRFVPRQAPEITKPSLGAPVDASGVPELVGALLEPSAAPECSVAYLSPDGPVALPAMWDCATGRASIARCLVERTGRLPGSAIAITLDASLGTRPTDKYGLMLRGRGRLMEAPDPTLVSFEVGGARLTWWLGFESNTIEVGALD